MHQIEINISFIFLPEKNCLIGVDVLIFITIILDILQFSVQVSLLRIPRNIDFVQIITRPFVFSIYNFLVFETQNQLS